MMLDASENHRMKPRIGITGSFGRGNYGDELYVKAYQHWFGKWADLYLLTGLPRASYLRPFGETLVKTVDAVVLGGGDLLCPYRTSIDRDFINPMYLHRPLHIAGIGVERNKPEIDETVLARWTKFLTAPSIASISTRDPGSKEWIENNISPNVSVTSHPDLVCALPLPKATKPEGAPILGLTTRHIKHPKEYALVAEIASKMIAKGWRVRHIIGGVGTHGVKDFENSKTLEVQGKETVYTEKLDDISRALGECSLLLSMKLHTTIVGTMYGVPTIAVNPVVKAKAFMDSFGRGHLAVSSLSPDLESIIEAGVPPVPAADIQKLRQDASDYFRTLGQRLWSDFRSASPERMANLPEAAPLPAK